MGLHDEMNNLETRRAISPHQVSDTTAAVSQIIDTANFSTLTFVITTGTLAAADATFTLLVEDGDASDLADNAAVIDAELVGTEAGADFIFSDDDSVSKIGYIGAKRYVRITITPVANTGAADFGAVAILTGGRKGPYSTQLA